MSLPFRAENLVTQLRNFIILVLLQFVAAASMSASSFDFVSPRTFSVGDAPYSVAMADFNGDGKLDLAVGNQFYYVSILMGNGDGTFGPPVNYNLGDETEARSIVVGDFNGDGHPDLAAGILDGIQVLINKGDGTFYPPVLYGVGGFPCQPASIAIGDFNRDHKLDLVAATVYCGVAVLQGNGDGTFQTFKAHNAGTSRNNMPDQTGVQLRWVTLTTTGISISQRPAGTRTTIPNSRSFMATAMAHSALRTNTVPDKLPLR